MELTIERRKSNKPSHRDYEIMGIMPDASGTYQLRDGRAITVDTSKVHPKHKIAHDSGITGYPIHLQLDPALSGGRNPKDSVALAKLEAGVEVLLNHLGRGSLPLTNTRRLIVELDQPITTGADILGTLQVNYPDYPQIKESGYTRGYQVR